MQPDFQNSKTSANDTAGNFYFSGNYFWIIAHFRKTFWNVRCRHFILQQVVVKWDWVWKVWLNCLFTNYERKCLLEEDFNFSGISPDPPSSNSRIPGWMWQTGKLSEWGKVKNFFSWKTFKVNGTWKGATYLEDWHAKPGDKERPPSLADLTQHPLKIISTIQWKAQDGHFVP